MTKGIYCYIDKNNDQIVYIGKDSNIHEKRRYYTHKAPNSYNLQPFNRILQNNPSRYQYQILWQVTNCTNNHLNQMEIYYINKYNPKFNFTNGGEGLSGFKHSKKSKEKMSNAHKGLIPWNKGKTLSKEHKRKISQNHHDVKGKNNPNYGKTISEETRIKISNTKNTTGFYRVCKIQDKKMKKGFRWLYSYSNKNQKKRITATNLEILEKKVKKKNLKWYIINEQNAKKSLKENKKNKKIKAQI